MAGTSEAYFISDVCMSARKKHSPDMKVGYLYVILVVIIALLAVYMLASMHGFRRTDNGAGVQLNTSSVDAIIGINYTMVSQNNVSNFTHSVSREGFVSSSVRVFNAEQPINEYGSKPDIVSVILYGMGNSSQASAQISNFLFSNNANVSIAGNANSNGVVTTYDINGQNIKFYTIPSIALLNTSIVNNASLKKYGPLSIPVFQDTSMFQYKNYIGIVVTNGYTSNMSMNYSLALSKQAAKLLGSRIIV